jgi:hypothetical protein
MTIRLQAPGSRLQKGDESESDEKKERWGEMIDS